mmetsp:Transcript_12855/g.38275  ORF Transcript_12855/g.38275 Transcript_12855/m.38275 type:complete len:403 (-) Transcript_12855:10-1218(-)
MARGCRLLFWLATCSAFAPPPRRLGRAPPRAAEEDAASSEENDAFYASLRARTVEVNTEAVRTRERWRTGKCLSKIAVAAPDWIRRMAYEDGLVVFGTASGGVGACRVGAGRPAEAGEIVAAHERLVPGQNLEALHGEYDGGGVVALCLAGSYCASGGREGRVKVHRVAAGPSLETCATVELSAKSPVSAVALSEDARQLYACNLDGTVARFDANAGRDEWTVAWLFKKPSAALALALDERRGALVVGGPAETAAFDVDSSAPLCSWPASGRSLAIAEDTVYAGGQDGGLTRRGLAEGDAFALAPEPQDGSSPALMPRHGGAIVSIGLTPDGLLCSAARDGTLRIWDVSKRGEEKALFGFGGYKVWLGSLACDSNTLITDGSDNTIIMHDFGKDPEPSVKSQ